MPQSDRFSAFFAQWVCSLASTPPHVAASPPPNGGNDVIRTTTRRRHADSQLLMLQTPTDSSAEDTGGPGGTGCGARGWWKNGNWTHAQPHSRYKTRPAAPFSPHARYKTRPARPKWPFLARFSHAWRTLYRCRHQQATHGELCTACEAETGLAITAHQAPLARRAPQGQEDQAAVPMGGDDTTAPKFRT